jgi:hypothetical protein
MGKGMVIRWTNKRVMERRRCRDRRTYGKGKESED